MRHAFEVDEPSGERWNLALELLADGESAVAIGTLNLYRDASGPRADGRLHVESSCDEGTVEPHDGQRRGRCRVRPRATRWVAHRRAIRGTRRRARGDDRLRLRLRHRANAARERRRLTDRSSGKRTSSRAHSCRSAWLGDRLLQWIPSTWTPSGPGRTLQGSLLHCAKTCYVTMRRGRTQHWSGSSERSWHGAQTCRATSTTEVSTSRSNRIGTWSLGC